jgi:hypothetical protein
MAVVCNVGYAYPQGYAKTSYGVYKIEKKKLFIDKHLIIRAIFRVNFRIPRPTSLRIQS